MSRLSRGHAPLEDSGDDARGRTVADAGRLASETDQDRTDPQFVAVVDPPRADARPVDDDPAATEQVDGPDSHRRAQRGCNETSRSRGPSAGPDNGGTFPPGSAGGSSSRRMARPPRARIPGPRCSGGRGPRIASRAGRPAGPIPRTPGRAVGLSLPDPEGVDDDPLLTIDPPRSPAVAAPEDPGAAPEIHAEDLSRDRLQVGVPSADPPVAQGQVRARIAADHGEGLVEGPATRPARAVQVQSQTTIQTARLEKLMHDEPVLHPPRKAPRLRSGVDRPVSPGLRRSPAPPPDDFGIHSTSIRRSVNARRWRFGLTNPIIPTRNRSNTQVAWGKSGTDRATGRADRPGLDDGVSSSPENASPALLRINRRPPTRHCAPGSRRRPPRVRRPAPGLRHGIARRAPRPSKFFRMARTSPAGPASVRHEDEVRRTARGPSRRSPARDRRI